MKTLKWVVGRHLPVKVKMYGAVGYGSGLDSKRSVHEVVSEIRDAVNRMAGVMILVIICSNAAVLTT